MKKEVVETTMVTPSEEMRRQGLWLSNLDLQSPHIYTTVLNYYPAPAGRPEHRGGACDPERLKVALARALVPFYPLAGRLSLGEDGRRYVDCNGEGVRFFVARADVTGPELFDDYQPSPEVTETFVPNMPPEELPCLVALFQLTFLKCGGVVLTSSFHHALIDGTGLFHFMQSWSRLARGLDAAEAVGPQAPFHDRTSLRARAPPLQQMGVGDPAPPAAHSLNFAATSCPRAFVARVYPFPHTLVHELTSRCCRAASVSRFAAVTAHIWRCMCVARRLAPDSDTHLGVIVNVRARLRPPLPHSFFGNAALQAPALPRRVGDVIDGPPASVVGMIMDAVNSVDDTYVRSVVDYHEVPKENLVLGAMEPPESDVAMVSWLGMPLYDADFGWGVPELVMPTTVSVFSGMVLVLPRGLDKESGIIVVVNLEPEYLPAFKKLLYDVVL